MANYQILKADIDEKIYENAQQKITGANLNSVLNAMVATLGAEYQFAGVATIDTNPEASDAKVFYIANGKGTYTNFGGINVTEDDVVILYYDTSWHKVATGMASQEKLTELKYDSEEIKQSFDISTNVGTDIVEYPGMIVRKETGLIEPETGYNTSEMFPIKGGEIYSQNHIVYLAYYDVDKNYISRPNISTTQITTPSNACYARICSSHLANTWQLNEGETLLTFEKPLNKIKNSALREEDKTINYLIKIVGFGDSSTIYDNWHIGDVFFNTSSNLLRRCISVNGTTATGFETVDFYAGAIYSFNKDLYIWNGGEMVCVTNDYIFVAKNYSTLKNAAPISEGQKFDTTVGWDCCYIPIKEGERFRVQASSSVTDQQYRLCYSVQEPAIGVVWQNRTVNSAVLNFDTISVSPVTGYVVLSFISNFLLSLSFSKEEGYSERINDLEISSIHPSTQETLLPIEFGGIEDNGKLSFDNNFFKSLRTSKILNLCACPQFSLVYDTTNWSVSYFWYDDNLSFVQKTTVIPDSHTNFLKIKFVRNDNGDIEYIPSFAIRYNGILSYTSNVLSMLNSTRFQYEVNSLNGNALLGNIDELNDPIVRTYDCGWLRLPVNYSPNGEPTRLAIFCHGSGGFDWGSKGMVAEWEQLLAYLGKEGYGVMCIYGLGKINHDTYYNGTVLDNMGTPIAMSCYQSAYRWVMQNFNFKKDGVVIFGKSLGGAMVGNLMYQNCIPVLAAAGLAPTMDVVSEIMRNRPAEFLKFYADQFGMEGNIDFNTATAQQKNEYFQNNAHKTVGYNPIFNGLLNANHKQLEILADSHPVVDTGNEHPEERQAFESLAKIQKVPYKVWIAVDDINVDPRFCDYMQKMVKNGGGVYQLRWMPANTGKHWAVDRGHEYDGVYQYPIRANVKPLYSNETLLEPVSFIEMVSWWRRFEH